jgi:type III pantothenate kinase
LLADGRLGAVQARAYDDGHTWLAALPEGQQACLANVASLARREALLAALSARFTQVHQAQTQAVLGPLRIAYAEPAHLGVDRFLAMLAATGTDASLVVGVGTALTLDVLDASGRHRGGRIAPSPQLMREALHARAAQLPADGGHYAEFADDTAHALASGCEGAALALIERSLHRATELLGAPPRLWLHGGGAPALRPQLPAHLWQPDAVLLGLARWYPLRHAQIT